MMRAPRRVLVVEDESSQRVMYARALRLMDFESVCVDTGEAAHRELDSQRYAVVILDLQLYGELSLDLFEEIRERHPAVSVIIATGHGSFELARRSIQRDVVDFLCKPVPLGELERALDRAWRRHVLVQTPVGELMPPPDSGSRVDPSEHTAPISERADLSLAAMERDLIMEALRRSNDNRKVAADMLGISERKLYYRLTEYRLS